MKLSNVVFISLFIFGVACSGAPQNPNLGKKKGSGNGVGETVSGGESGSGSGGASQTGLTIDLQDQTVASSIPRLSHTQWENSVKDLLLLDKISGLSSSFPDDPTGFAFGNNGASYSVSANQWTAYRDAAEALGERIAKDSAAIQKLIPKGVTDPKAIVTAFLTRAYRRPPTSADVDLIAAMFSKGTPVAGATDAKAPGFAAMISLALQSPFFIYRVERGDKSSGRYKTLDAYEIASRLSYGIWDSMPDEALFAAAKSGELLKPAVIQTQVRRLLDDPRGNSLLTSIHTKGYRIDQFKAVPQDKTNYPEGASLDTKTIALEAQLFVDDVVVKSGKAATELFTAPYAFVSVKTAPIYEVAETSTEPKKVSLDPEHRAGLLSQVAFLSNFSKPEGQTGIITRGVYVAQTLLCTTLGGAPPNVDDGAVGDFKTNRERVSALTGKGSCAGCHTPRINPAGFALENFSVTGKWRTAELNGTALDASGEYWFKNDSIKFNGPVEFMSEIVKRDEFHQCYAQKIVEGLYGRYADGGDADLIRRVGEASLKGASAKDLFQMVLTDKLLTLRSNQ